MPRVLCVFEPPDGGVAINVEQLALGLGAHGFEVELAGPEEADPYPELRRRGIRIHRAGFARGYGTPGQDLKAARRVATLLRTGRFDLVHCHSSKAGVLGRMVAAAARIPVVYSPHCWPFIGDFGAPRRLFSTNVERALAPLTSRIICVSRYERDLARTLRVAGDKRMRVVHNGTEPCPDEPPDAPLAALRGLGPTVAAISVLRAQKRVDVFLDAAPLVLAGHPTAQLAVIGNGPLADELHARAAALGLDDEPRFAFLPFRAPSARYLRALDVYVLSSSWESLPIGVLEALACGVPQVATDVGGTGEIVAPDTGRLVPPEDPHALAGAILDVLGDPARREEMGSASRARHTDSFGVEAMLASTAAVYREALGEA